MIARRSCIAALALCALAPPAGAQTAGVEPALLNCGAVAQTTARLAQDQLDAGQNVTAAQAVLADGDRLYRQIVSLHGLDTDCAGALADVTGPIATAADPIYQSATGVLTGGLPFDALADGLIDEIRGCEQSIGGARLQLAQTEIDISGLACGWGN